VEHLTVPNPDYLSNAKDAIAPKDERVTVQHKNALRLEAKGLAKPYKVYVKPWQVSDAALLNGAEIDPKKDLT
jgi:hypothetical protein